jgi:hypothetical protein
MRRNFFLLIMSGQRDEPSLNPTRDVTLKVSEASDLNASRGDARDGVSSDCQVMPSLA